jgi:hypothetical protein
MANRVCHERWAADIGKQREWREECSDATDATRDSLAPLRTTAGICVVDRALYMFGGSQGRPNNSDIKEFGSWG